MNILQQLWYKGPSFVSMAKYAIVQVKSKMTNSQARWGPPWDPSTKNNKIDDSWCRIRCTSSFLPACYWIKHYSDCPPRCPKFPPIGKKLQFIGQPHKNKCTCWGFIDTYYLNKFVEILHQSLLFQFNINRQMRLKARWNNSTEVELQNQQPLLGL